MSGMRGSVIFQDVEKVTMLAHRVQPEHVDAGNSMGSDSIDFEINGV